MQRATGFAKADTDTDIPAPAATELLPPNINVFPDS